MPIIGKAAVQQAELYIRVFTQEFVNEFKYLVDVEAGRAQGRLNFTDQLKSVLKKVLDIMPFGQVAQLLGDVAMGIIQEVSAMDWVQDLTGELTNKVMDKLIGDGSSAGTSATSAQMGFEPEALRFVIEAVAREAVHRYEFFLRYRLSNKNPQEGVIPFATTGVGRCLNYVMNHLSKTGKMEEACSVEFLSRGLIDGLSGRGVTGFKNTYLAGEQKAHSHLSAEGAYAHSGFYSKESGQYWAFREPSGTEKLKGFFKDKSKQSCYVSFVDKQGAEPKYGYMIVPEILPKGYGYVSHTPGELIRREWESFEKTRIYRHVTAREIDEYLKQRARGYSKLNDFIAKERDTYCQAVCHDDLRGIVLAGGDFSRVDFSGATLGGDISGSNFDEAYLFRTRFEKVFCENGKPASFRASTLAFACLTKARLAEADFTQAELAFADVTGADLRQARLAGVNWYKARTTGLLTEVDFNKEQKESLIQLQKRREEHDVLLKALSSKWETLAVWQEQMVARIAKITEQAEQKTGPDKDPKITQLEEQIENVYRQQDYLLRAEQSCRAQLLHCNEEQTQQRSQLDTLRQALAGVTDAYQSVNRDLEMTQEQVSRLVSSELPQMKEWVQALQSDLIQQQEFIKREKQGWDDYRQQVDQRFLRIEKNIEKLQDEVAFLAEERRKSSQLEQQLAQKVQRQDGNIEELWRRLISVRERMPPRLPVALEKWRLPGSRFQLSERPSREVNQWQLYLGRDSGDIQQPLLIAKFTQDEERFIARAERYLTLMSQCGGMQNLFGVCFDKGFQALIARMPPFTLRELLQRPHQTELLHRVFTETVRALVLLHQNEQAYGGLSVDSILCDEAGHVQLCLFDMSAFSKSRAAFHDDIKRFADILQISYEGREDFMPEAYRMIGQACQTESTLSSTELLKRLDMYPQSASYQYRCAVELDKLGDAVKAFKCLMLGKDLSGGDARIWARLGVCFMNGHGCEQDEKQAIVYFTKAAEAGDANSQYYLAKCLSRKDSLHYSQSQSQLWYHRAAEQGHEKAKKLLNPSARLN